MFLNFKLYFKYLLLKFDFFFMKNRLRDDKTTTIVLQPMAFYFTALHLKLSTLTYSLQLTEFFSYELPVENTTLVSNLFVYNFYSHLVQQRFFLFVIRHPSSKAEAKLVSLAELFLNASWLEREVAELHGCFFTGKKDLRNLMLQYGDNSAPFQKSFPSIGSKEIFYDVTNDTLVQLPMSLQF